MPIEITCACGKKYRVEDQFAGRAVRCKACGGTIQVPRLAAQPSASASSLTTSTQSRPSPVAPATPTNEEIGEPEISPTFANSNSSSASNPAMLKIDFKAMWMHDRTDFWIFGAIALLSVPLFIRGFPIHALAPIGLAVVILLNSLREKAGMLAGGNVNPAVIVGQNPWRVAIYADLSTGHGDVKPSIKVIEAKLDQMTDGPPAVGKHLAVVAQYYSGADREAWADFSPKIIQLETTKLPQVRRLVASIPVEEWDALASGIQRVDTSKIAFYKLWQDPTFNIYAKLNDKSGHLLITGVLGLIYLIAMAVACFGKLKAIF